MKVRVLLSAALCALLACKSFDGDPAPASVDGDGGTSSSSSSGSTSSTSSGGELVDGEAACAPAVCDGILCDNFDRKEAAPDGSNWAYRGYNPDHDFGIDQEAGSCAGTLRAHVGHQTSDDFGERMIRQVIGPKTGDTLGTITVELDLKVDTSFAGFDSGDYRTVLAVLTTDSDWAPGGNYLAIGVDQDPLSKTGRLIVTSHPQGAATQSVSFLLNGNKLAHLVWQAQAVAGETSLTTDGVEAVKTGFPGLGGTKPKTLQFLMGVGSTKGSPEVTAHFDNVKVTSQ